MDKNDWYKKYALRRKVILLDFASCALLHYFDPNSLTFSKNIAP